MGTCGSSNAPPGLKISVEVLNGRIERGSKSGSLALDDIGLRAIPEAVWQAKNLRVVDLSQNEIEVFGDGGQSMAAFHKIKKLRLKSNRLELLPPEFGELNTLEQLDISNNNLTSHSLPSLPSKSLVELSVANNPFDGVLAASIFTCTRLKTLDISGTGLRELPKALHALQALAELIADNNPTLSNLSTVDWSNLGELHTLSVKNSALEGRSAQFPPSLFTDTKLHTLRLDGSPIVDRMFNMLEGVQIYQDRRRVLFARGDRVG